MNVLHQKEIFMDNLAINYSLLKWKAIGIAVWKRQEHSCFRQKMQAGQPAFPTVYSMSSAKHMLRHKSKAEK